jgi:hypothetical protein
MIGHCARTETIAAQIRHEGQTGEVSHHVAGASQDVPLQQPNTEG